MLIFDVLLYFSVGYGAAFLLRFLGLFLHSFCTDQRFRNGFLDSLFAFVVGAVGIGAIVTLFTGVGYLCFLATGVKP